MLFSKPSKKTDKNPVENAAVTEITAAAESAKPRASRSSKSKSSESSETGSVRHRKSANKTVATEVPPAAEVKTMAAAAGLESTKPVVAQPVQTVVATENARSAVLSVSRDDVAKLAYSYWVQRGYAPGSPEQDWLRAERELAARQ